MKNINKKIIRNFIMIILLFASIQNVNAAPKPTNKGCHIINYIRDYSCSSSSWTLTIKKGPGTVCDYIYSCPKPSKPSTPSTPPAPKKCDYNNSSHFSNATSGPNGEDCCLYVWNHTSDYGINQKQLFDKYPVCATRVLNGCKFDLNTQNPTCDTETTTGYVKDIDDSWRCIYASSYSSNTSVKDYFIKYGNASSDCSVYCREEVEYTYPGNSMKTLAGTYFTIADDTTGNIGINIETNNFNASFKASSSTLGPIQTTVTKECSILGNTNNKKCTDAINNELNSIKAPTIQFSYESESYNNPSVTLVSTQINTENSTKDDSVDKGKIYIRKNTYSYSLPDSTYKYVSKNSGISFKSTTNVLASTPYMNIGPHLPIDFKSNIVGYQIAVTDFGSENFNNLVLKGKTINTTLSVTIENYVRNLISGGYANPVMINGIYYLDRNFVSLLEKNEYSADDLVKSACGDTENYTCYSDYNGIYCYDENTTTNSENTYRLFNTCIIKTVSNANNKSESFKNDMLYACSFNIQRGIHGNSSNGIGAIYRPISLDNPFPNIDAKGRITGDNWCGINNDSLDCSNDNSVVTNFITNNRSVTTEEIYRKLDPLYTITLTPSLIKEIRSYNDKHPYDDFNLECADGKNCKSNFIRDEFKNYFSGCGINDRGLRCDDNDKW